MLEKPKASPEKKEKSEHDIFWTCLNIASWCYTLAKKFEPFAKKDPTSAIMKHYKWKLWAANIPLRLWMIAASRKHYTLGDVIMTKIRWQNVPFLVADYCWEAEKNNTSRLLDIVVPKDVRIPPEWVRFSESVKKIWRLESNQMSQLKKNPEILQEILSGFEWNIANKA